MSEIIWRRFRSHSDNPKSKTCTELSRSIKNRKWLGLSVMAFLLVVVGAVAQAQQPGKIPRIGLLAPFSASSGSARRDAFLQGLRDLGYVEGKNITIEYRYTEGELERLLDLAAELVRLDVDVIVTAAISSVRAAKRRRQRFP
jgi:putative ABC transport system substrate-binding protein